MFDIACAAHVLGDTAIIEPLFAFPAECEAALDVVRKMDPGLVVSTNARLMVRGNFLAFQKTAQSAARAILEAAISN
jgi:hypothetical protein